MKTKLFVITLAFPMLAFTSGGVIVGNGAGISEQNIIFAYNTLVESLDQCLSDSPVCNLTIEEKAQIELIRKVQKINLVNANNIQFTNEKEKPGFFTLSSNEPFRIAKTGLTPDATIWFNSDLLYTNEGISTIDFALATALIIHEVGHQTGNPNHSFLDSIGAKVRFALEQKKIQYDFEPNNSQYSLQVINFDNPTLRSFVFLNTLNSKIFLTPYIVATLRCPTASSVLTGFEVWNGYWSTASAGNLSKLSSFNAWISFNCIEDGILRNERANLKIEFGGPDLDRVDKIQTVNN